MRSRSAGHTRAGPPGWRAQSTRRTRWRAYRRARRPCPRHPRRLRLLPHRVSQGLRRQAAQRRGHGCASSPWRLQEARGCPRHAGGLRRPPGAQSGQCHALVGAMEHSKTAKQGHSLMGQME
eukprot:354315-Chlamydomonas_euryale.AAC.2